MTTQSNLQERYEKILDLGQSSKDDLDKSLEIRGRLLRLWSQISKGVSKIHNSIWLNYTLSIMGVSILILGAAYLVSALILYILLH